MSIMGEPSRLSSRRVTYTQLELLWEALNNRRDVALGYNKSTQAREFSRRMWEEIALTLNSEGDGAVKDWKGWSKYWNDYKCKLKKLVTASNRSNRQTGGGPSTAKPLSEIELKFLQILGDNYGLGLPGRRVEPVVEEIQAEIPDSETIAAGGSDSILNYMNLAPSLQEAGPSCRVTPPRNLSPTALPSIDVPRTPSPVPPTTPAPMTPLRTRPLSDRQGPARRSPRRRRQRREQFMSAEAARRALVRESQRRAEIDERNSLMFRELIDDIKEIKHICQRFTDRSIDGE